MQLSRHRIGRLKYRRHLYRQLSLLRGRQAKLSMWLVGSHIPVYGIRKVIAACFFSVDNMPSRMEPEPHA